MSTISQSVHGAVLCASGKYYKCVVLLKTAESVELLLRGFTLEVDQRLRLSSGDWEAEAIVKRQTRTGDVCVLRCALLGG